MRRLDIEVVEIPAHDASERAYPFAQVRQALRDVELSSRAVHLDRDQSLDAALLVDPPPDLSLMLL